MFKPRCCRISAPRLGLFTRPGPFTTQADRLRPRLEDGRSQSLDLQRNAPLQAAGVDAVHVYRDCASVTTGLGSRPRGHHGVRKFALSKAQVRLAQAAMAYRDTSVSALCRELGIRPVTLYRYSGHRASCASKARRASLLDRGPSGRCERQKGSNIPA